MSGNLTWAGLRRMPVGMLLKFPEPYDIYPHCIVPGGTLAIVAKNNLGDEFPTIDLLPADADVCKALDEWNGCVSLAPMNDGYSWTDDSPVSIHV